MAELKDIMKLMSEKTLSRLRCLMFMISVMGDDSNEYWDIRWSFDPNLRHVEGLIFDFDCSS